MSERFKGITIGCGNKCLEIRPLRKLSKRFRISVREDGSNLSLTLGYLYTDWQSELLVSFIETIIQTVRDNSSSLKELDDAFEGWYTAEAINGVVA